MGNVANDGLPALSDVYLLHRDRLFAAVPVSLESFHLDYKGSHKLVERSLRTIQRFKKFGLGEFTSELHRCRVNGRHLGGQHGLNLIPRFDPLNNREYKIQFLLVEFVTACLNELVNKAESKVTISRANGLDEERKKTTA